MKRITLLLAACTLLLGAGPTAEKAGTFGDWALYTRANSRGQTLIYLSHDPTPEHSLRIHCSGARYGMVMKYSRPGEMADRVEVRYKVGEHGEIIESPWQRNSVANVTHNDDANPIVERMQQAKGLGKFKIWVPGVRFEPSLEQFPAAMKAFEAICQV